MGEAKLRGSQAERIENAKIGEAIDKAEVLIALHEDENGTLQVQFIPRDAEPNQESLAMVMAAYLNHEWKNLAGQAMALYLERQEHIHGMRPGQVTLPGQRSLLDAQGNLARDTDAVPKIIVPGGH